MKWGSTCSVTPIWIVLCLVLADLFLACQFEDATEFSSTGLHKILKRQAKKSGCVLPTPLENGRFYPSARRCHQKDSTPACQMIPGTPVPHNWVIFSYCDAGFTLNTTKPLSVCISGYWRPSLPACKGESECSTNSQCPGKQTCIVGKCRDPCGALCGPNTVCEVSYHRPLCTCKTGFVGNPFKECNRGDQTTMKLLLTQSTQVSVFDLSLKKISAVLHYQLFTHHNPKENSPSVAYHHERKYVFYTGPKQIFRDTVAGRLTRKGPPVAVVASRVDDNAKLAVDWVHDKLYWMSHTHGTVEVTDLDGGNRTTLVSAGLTFNWNLNNIAVDPYAGFLFLVSNDSIYKMNLDGTNFTRLSLAGEKTRGVYVLALQTQKKQIYYSSWELDESTPYITTCDYEGRNGKDIPIGHRWSEIHALDVFRDTLFFGHFRFGESDQVWSVDLASATPRPVKIHTVGKGFVGMKVFHPDVQKEPR